MVRRLQLHEILCEILGSRNVYYQPPATVKMQYPAIVYNRESNDTLFADDHPYHWTRRYRITVIDPNPDSEIPDEIAKLPLCTLDRPYTADNLNHFPLNLYF